MQSSTRVAENEYQKSFELNSISTSLGEDLLYVFFYAQTMFDKYIILIFFNDLIIFTYKHYKILNNY